MVAEAFSWIGLCKFVKIVKHASCNVFDSALNSSIEGVFPKILPLHFVYLSKADHKFWSESQVYVDFVQNDLAKTVSDLLYKQRSQDN